MITDYQRLLLSTLIRSLYTNEENEEYEPGQGQLSSDVDWDSAKKVGTPESDLLNQFTTNLPVGQGKADG